MRVAVGHLVARQHQMSWVQTKFLFVTNVVCQMLLLVATLAPSALSRTVLQLVRQMVFRSHLLAQQLNPVAFHPAIVLLLLPKLHNNLSHSLMAEAVVVARLAQAIGSN